MTAVTGLGIDVSNNNGHVDVAALKHAHPDLIVLGVKASEGTGYMDNYRSENFSQAQKAGLVVNFYHFARPSEHPGAAGGVVEADYLWDAVKVYRAEASFGRLVLDYEEHADPVFAKAFCDRIKELSGTAPIVYLSGSRTGEAPKGYPLWIAAYGPQVESYVPQGAELYLWQYTDKLDGHFDASHVYVTEAELLGQAPAPATKRVLEVAGKGGRVFRVIHYGGGRVKRFLHSAAAHRDKAKGWRFLTRHKTK